MLSNFSGWRADQSIANKYVNYIEDILTDEEKFKNFRNTKDLDYTNILEHLSKKDGEKYYSQIKTQFDEHLNVLTEALKNDSVGNPITYDYDVNIKINPTTLRYTYVALDILNTFKNLNNINYIEIGAGYGGLVRLMSSLIKPQSISLFDLEPAMKLQEKYLNCFDIQSFKKNINKNFEVEENTILISNYAWCELDEEHRNLYMEKIINKCCYFYLTVYDVNIEKEFSHFKNLSIKKDFFNDCYVIKKT